MHAAIGFLLTSCKSEARFTVLKLSQKAREEEAKTRLETTSIEEMCIIKKQQPGSSIVTHSGLGYSFSANKRCFCALPAHTAVR